jgi:hypothetical protein
LKLFRQLGSTANPGEALEKAADERVEAGALPERHLSSALDDPRIN